MESLLPRIVHCRPIKQFQTFHFKASIRIMHTEHFSMNLIVNTGVSARTTHLFFILKPRLLLGQYWAKAILFCRQTRNKKMHIWDLQKFFERYSRKVSALTAAGKASGFSTLWGTIVETTKEHGFYISRIDLGDLLKKGSRFQNVYTANLHDCFANDEEHWSQEIAFPTKHLTLRIHFPKSRPPRLVKCKVVEGVADKQVRTDAKIMELSGENGIVWDIQSPKLKDIYKLEWLW
jgi:hypothetical protein